jgi:hypothetical protein
MDWIGLMVWLISMRFSQPICEAQRIDAKTSATCSLPFANSGSKELSQRRSTRRTSPGHQRRG